MSSIASAVETFILDEIVKSNGQSRLDYDQSLIASGILDSMAFLQLVGFLEEKFGITVEDNELLPANFETINAICTFVEQKSGAG
jgi:acyl carrier protein